MTAALGRARSLLRQSMPDRSGLVLLYHRVSDPATDPQLLAVSPRRFAEHLDVLRERYESRRLGELVDGAPAASKKRRVAITFDDGYADNLHQALPLLQASATPATFFVVAGQVGREEEFWWDELERIILSTPILPERLELSIGTDSFAWAMGPAGEAGNLEWNVLSEEVSSSRQAAYRALCDLLRTQGVESRESALARLRTWAGTSPTGRPANRALTEGEVFTLAADRLAEVGAHTMTHPVLASQPVEVQREEIDGGKRRLEALVDAPVRSFSYPYGGRDHYTRRTVELAKEAGFALACANFPGLVRRRTARYELPRFLVRDWSGDEFAQRIDAEFRS